MINFFGNQDNESTDSRLDSIEWKVNLLLALVGIHLGLSVLRFAKSMLPSTFTIVVIGALLAAGCWFLRDRIGGMVRRMVAQQIVGDDRSEGSSSSSRSSQEKRIL